MKAGAKYMSCLRDEDVSRLKLSLLKLKERGKVEEYETALFILHSGEAKERVEAEGFLWITLDDLLGQSLRPGDKLYIAELKEGLSGIDLFTRYNEDRLMTAYDRRRVNPVKAFFKHLHTVNHHRRLVRRECFRVGLIWQGLVHDLSKYSPEEFLVGVRYYQGTRSPNVAERNITGYSRAWLHHKGRNKHHQEYWTDYSAVTGNILEFVPMPKRYLVESVMDRIAACKVYRGKDYDDGAPLDYLTTRDSESHMNKENYEELVFIFSMLKEKGEKDTFKYLKKEYLK